MEIVSTLINKLFRPTGLQRAKNLSQKGMEFYEKALTSDEECVKVGNITSDQEQERNADIELYYEFIQGEFPF